MPVAMVSVLSAETVQVLKLPVYDVATFKRPRQADNDYDDWIGRIPAGTGGEGAEAAGKLVLNGHCVLLPAFK